MIELPNKSLNENFWPRKVIEEDREALEFYQRLWSNERCRYCSSEELRISRAIGYEEIAYALICKNCGKILKIGFFKSER